MILYIYIYIFIYLYIYIYIFSVPAVAPNGGLQSAAQFLAASQQVAALRSASAAVQVRINALQQVAAARQIQKVQAESMIRAQHQQQLLTGIMRQSVLPNQGLKFLNSK